MTPSPNPPAAPSPTGPTAPESFELTLPDDPDSGKDWYLWAGVLALLVLVVFYPAINGQMIWDDDRHVGLIASMPDLSGLVKVWTMPRVTPQYYPLTYTSFWLEQLIWKDNTLGYHLGNMLLHACSAVLIWRILRRLRLPGAWLVAAIWAIHPIQAESVCWMSERKNVLSGPLFFASIWFYMDFADFPAKDDLGGDSSFRVKPRGLAYALSLLLLTLGLLAKTVVCAMPAVMLIIFWWRGRKILSRKTLGPLIPFFAVGLVLSGVTVFLEDAIGGNIEARGPDWAVTPLERVLIAAQGAWFYPSKLIWPAKLTFSYPRILPDPQSLGAGLYAVQWVYLIAAVAAVAALWLGRKRLGRGPLAAVLIYGVTLFPSLGFINIYPMRYSFVADHFQYLAGLSMIALAVAAAAALTRRLAPGARLSLGVLVLGGCCVLAWRQSGIYLSPTTLWTDTLAKNPDSWMASHNLASEDVKLGQQKSQDATAERVGGQSDVAADDSQASHDYYDQAEQLYRRALALHPTDYTSHTGLGVIYELTARYPQAETEMRQAVDSEEHDDPLRQAVAPYVDYAKLLQTAHPDMDVLPWLEKASEIAQRRHAEPKEVCYLELTLGNYWSRRAALAAKAGDTEKETTLLNRALEELMAGLKQQPDSIGGEFDLGRVYQRLGVLDRRRADEALAQGHAQDAAKFEERSLLVDDPQALKAYQTAQKNSRNHQLAPALVGIGELYYEHTAFNHETQYSVISDLLLSMKSFQDALKIDPTVADAAKNLQSISDRLYQEGLLADQHESTWSVLRDKLGALTAGVTDKAAVIAADKAAVAALWPTAQSDPLRPPLVQFHSAAQSAAANGSPESYRNVRDAADNVLSGLGGRDARRSVILDAIAAGLCYEGAVTAGDHAAPAWQKLQAVADELAKAAAANGDAPDIQHALDQARFVLEQNRAATQPAAATRPVGN